MRGCSFPAMYDAPLLGLDPCAPSTRGAAVLEVDCSAVIEVEERFDVRVIVEVHHTTLVDGMQLKGLPGLMDIMVTLMFSTELDTLPCSTAVPRYHP